MTKLNWELNFKEEANKESKIYFSDVYKHIPKNEIPSQKYDLVICIPPYLPTLGYDNLCRDSCFIGTHVLERVIIETKKYGRQLVIGCSSMAFPEFEQAVNNVRAERYELGKRMRAFNIAHAFNKPYTKDYINTLINEGKIMQRNDSPFKLWYNFYIFKIVYT